MQPGRRPAAGAASFPETLPTDREMDAVNELNLWEDLGERGRQRVKRGKHTAPRPEPGLAWHEHDAKREVPNVQRFEDYKARVRAGPKRGMFILGLFSGISADLFATLANGIRVDTYVHCDNDEATGDIVGKWLGDFSPKTKLIRVHDVRHLSMTRSELAKRADGLDCDREIEEARLQALYEALGGSPTTRWRSGPADGLFLDMLIETCGLPDILTFGFPCQVRDAARALRRPCSPPPSTGPVPRERHPRGTHAPLVPCRASFSPSLSLFSPLFRASRGKSRNSSTMQSVSSTCSTRPGKAVVCRRTSSSWRRTS